MKAVLKRFVMGAILLAVMVCPLPVFADTLTSPLLDFTPPDISFTYAEGTSDYSLTIENTGDGIAQNIYLYVDFGVLDVIASSYPYTPGANPYFKLPDIPAGGNCALTFTLGYSAWCSGSTLERTVLWRPYYHDLSGNEFFAGTEISSINPVAGASNLTVSVTGPGPVIKIGDVISYTVASAFTGRLSCGSGTTGLITVVDSIPDGFMVTDADGGIYVPGGGGTGGTVTWTYTPPEVLSKTITVESPTVADCETYCNTTFANSVSASGIDCFGCNLSAVASETTAIECCAEGVTSEKIAIGPTQRCSDTTYINTYVFDAGFTRNLKDLIFTEHAENQQLYNNNLSIMLNGLPLIGSATVTNTTPGGSLVLDFSGAPATPMANTTLSISYKLTATAATVAACGGSTFYSWSSLNMGASGSSCLADGVIHETTPVTIGSPGMSLDITGLAAVFPKCESQTITLTLTQTSTFNPRDVTLKLSGLNYYVIDPTNPAAITCSGVAPVDCLPTMDGNGDYIWTFNDSFTGQNQSASIELTVQKRCSGTGELVATAYFDDQCTDDAASDELCSVIATETPALLLSGDLLIEIDPDVLYPTATTAQWIIYVTNRGTGTAYNVWVEDVLGSGFSYASAVVDDMTGVTVTENLDHSGTAINGANIAIADMAAGERRMITFTADIVDSNNLTNSATASWGCISVDCQAAVSDTNFEAPTVTGISPANGPTAGGTSITITGTDLIGATAVTIGGAAATGITVVNASTITATTPAGTAGARDVAVTTSWGTGTGSGLFTYFEAPTVSSISPANGPTAGGTSVTITGTDLTGATAITIGGTAATGIAVVNATTITATTPAGTAGARDVAVTTPGGTGTGSGLFTYIDAPTVTAILPATGPGAGGTSVTITGTNFTGATAVKFGGTDASSFNVNSATQITAVSPAGAAGTVDITVTTTGGTSATGAFDQFTWLAEYTLTVIHGTGGGNYLPATVVSIAANAPPAGQEFDKWTGDTANIANINLPGTTLVMPSAAATVTATYKAQAPSQYTLTVNSGTGSGSYLPGTVVSISAAAAPSGMEFDKWAGQTATVDDINSAATTVDMPFHDVTVTAGYIISRSGMAPEVGLKQGAFAIADGGSHDFGNRLLSSNTDVVFTIENTGTGNLILTAPIAIGGADADQFSIQTQPVSPVAASGNTSFTVRFAPTSTGAKTAILSIASNDGDENPYDLSLTGTAVALPTVITDAVSSMTSTGCTLNGTVNANNQSTTVSFEYGLTTAYGTTVTADQSPVTGTTATPVSRTLTGLAPNTTYHYRVRGNNAADTATGADVAFTTLAPDLTHPVVDDVHNTFGWTPVPGALSASDHEYSVDTGRTWITCSANPQPVPDEKMVTGQVQVRIKANPVIGRLAGNALLSDVPYTESADLALSMTASNLNPAVGETVVFFLTVTNKGPTNRATAVRVTQHLPSGLSYISDTPSGAYNPVTGVLQVGDLDSGGQALFEIRTQVNSGGKIIQRAVIDGMDQTDHWSGDNSATVELNAKETASSDLGISALIDNPAPAPGETVLLDITITNNGPDNATGISMEGLLPPGLGYIGDDAEGAYNPLTGLWGLGSLAAGEKAVLSLRASVIAAGEIITVFKAVNPDQRDPDGTNNTATVILTPETPRLSDLSLQLSVNIDTPWIGAAPVLTLTVRNNGPDDAHGVSKSPG